MSDFKSFGLPENIVSALTKLGITTPTPIQEQAIPLALEGHDVLGSAQTGTGKTLAYITPLCVHLLKDRQHNALVLTPTRELAIQVRDMVEKLLGRERQFDTALLIGGDPMPKQFFQLKKRPQLIIGTPGRINDHLDRGSLSLKNTQFLVLDETDRMLDMGFSEQLETICQVMPVERQTLMFSATMPNNIVRISKQYLKDAKRVSVGSTTMPVSHIKQDIIHTTKHDKFSHLLRELNEREGSVIVFVKTKMSCEDLKDKLLDENHLAEAIHGDLHQRKRERVVRSFRANKSRIMVATDVAARGLDVPHIRHVINYDLPQCPEDYIHRIGRTGRAGADGNALCLLAPDDRSKWRAIHQLMTPDQPFNFPKSEQGRGSDRGDRNDRNPRRSFGNGGSSDARGRDANRGSRKSSFGRDRDNDFGKKAPGRDTNSDFGKMSSRPKAEQKFELIGDGAFSKPSSPYAKPKSKFGSKDSDKKFGFDKPKGASRNRFSKSNDFNSSKPVGKKLAKKH